MYQVQTNYLKRSL